MIFGRIILEEDKDKNKNPYALEDNENDNVAGGEEDNGNEYELTDDAEQDNKDPKPAENDDENEYSLPQDGNDDDQKDDTENQDTEDNNNTEGGDNEDNEYAFGDDPEGGEENQDGDEETDNGTEDDTPTDPESESISAELIEKEKELFADLSPEQLAIKTSELRKNFTALYDNINTILEKVKLIPVTEKNKNVLEFIDKKLRETSTEIVNYSYYTFETKSYLQNAKQFNIYLLILKQIQQLFIEITDKK